MQKQTTSITDRNGGMHNQKAWRRIKAMLTGHDLRNARLYHLVMMLDTDDGQGGEVARYQRVLKALCLHLTESGIRYRWRACFERDPEKDRYGKGAHFHVFLLAEASFLNPCEIINHHRASNKNGWLRRMMDRHLVAHHVAPPKNDMHKTVAGKRQNYAYITEGAKLEDCTEWTSYLVKARSKPTDTKQIYFSSRDAITKKDAPPKAARKAKATRKATRIGKRSGTAIEPPQAAILDTIVIDAASAPAFVLLPFVAIESPGTPGPIAIDQPASAPAPALAPAIDTRQLDLFAPVSTSTGSDQPAPVVGKHGQKVSDERRATVKALLLDPDRAGLGDRAISRESGVSAPIIRAMRKDIAPTDGAIRTFIRGGKTRIMNTENIGRRPAAPN